MNEPYVNPDFNMEDIHEIREYNYKMTKNMTTDERDLYYKKRELRAKEV